MRIPEILEAIDTKERIPALPVHNAKKHLSVCVNHDVVNSSRPFPINSTYTLSGHYGQSQIRATETERHRFISLQRGN